MPGIHRRKLFGFATLVVQYQLSMCTLLVVEVFRWKYRPAGVAEAEGFITELGDVPAAATNRTACKRSFVPLLLGLRLAALPIISFPFSVALVLALLLLLPWGVATRLSAVPAAVPYCGEVGLGSLASRSAATALSTRWHCCQCRSVVPGEDGTRPPKVVRGN